MRIAVKICIVSAAGAAVIVVTSLLLSASSKSIPALKEHLFGIQSIDTMKYSRDEARAKANDATFDAEIAREMQQIASMGATHVAIGTPYDEEFVPYLRRWVAAARAAHLSVWFRGNFSGWEGWYGYQKLTAEKHTDLTKKFILDHPDLFQDGDVFTSCPECENGALGDPRTTGKVNEYRQFLIQESKVVTGAFKQTNKRVHSPFYSMNADVARLVMDQATTDALGNVVVIDHYVSSLDTFENDLKNIGADSKGKIALGEFGAPIPDLQGNLTEIEQAKYIDVLMSKMYLQSDNIIAVNYWVLQGGTTALVNQNGTVRKALEIVKKYYTAPYIAGTVLNTIGEPVQGAQVTVAGGFQTTTDANGRYQVFLPEQTTALHFESAAYGPQTITITRPEHNLQKDITLEPKVLNWRYRLREIIHNLQVQIGL
jgi:hypothetical protein